MNAYQITYWSKSFDDYKDLKEIVLAHTAADAVTQFTVKHEATNEKVSVRGIDAVTSHELVEFFAGRCCDIDHHSPGIREGMGISSGQRVERKHRCPTCGTVTTYEVERSGDDHQMTILGAELP